MSGTELLLQYCNDNEHHHFWLFSQFGVSVNSDSAQRSFNENSAKAPAIDLSASQQWRALQVSVTSEH